MGLFLVSVLLEDLFNRLKPIKCFISNGIVEDRIMNMRQFGFLLLALFLISCSEPNIQNLGEESEGQSSSSAEKRLKEKFATLTRNSQFMASLTIVRDTKPPLGLSVGFSDLNKQIPNDENTLFRIGSISKTYTAVLIFKAIEEGRLSLDTPLAQYFDSFPNASQVKIKHLLQHRSGIPSYTKDKSFFGYHTQFQSKQKMLALLESYESDFAPDSQAEYSNSNYFLLALMLEKAYQTTFSQLMKRTIVEPLALENTYDASAMGEREGKVQEAYSYRLEGNWHKLPETDLSVAFGAGSVISTTNEVAVFFEALFEGILLKESSLKQMMTIRDGYGLGLAQYTIAGHTAFGHRGAIDGFKSAAVYFPSEKVTFVLSSNASNDNFAEEFAAINKAYFNKQDTLLSVEELSLYQGLYIDSSNSEDSSQFVGENGLLHVVFPDGYKSKLVYKGEGIFVLEQLYADPMIYHFSQDGTQLFLEQSGKKSATAQVKQ